MSEHRARRAWTTVAWLLAGLALTSPAAAAPTTDSIALRGHVMTLRLYGTRGGPAAIVSSGDGGWIHLGPHVAETLAARGYFVVGVDVRAYLSTFTTGHETLRPSDEPGDYRVLADYAARGAAGQAGARRGVGGRRPVAAGGDRSGHARRDRRRRRPRPARHQRARLALARCAHLRHPRLARRADLQHREPGREGGAGAAGRHPLDPATSSCRWPRCSG